MGLERASGSTWPQTFVAMTTCLLGSVIILFFCSERKNHPEDPGKEKNLAFLFLPGLQQKSSLPTRSCASHTLRGTLQTPHFFAGRRCTFLSGVCPVASLCVQSSPCWPRAASGHPLGPFPTLRPWLAARQRKLQPSSQTDTLSPALAQRKLFSSRASTGRRPCLHREASVASSQGYPGPS